MEDKNPARRDLLSNRELAALCSQISMILKAGISITEGLSIIADDAETRQAKDVLHSLHAGVELGDPLYVALTKTGRFPRYMIDMTEIGEKTGNLDDVMDSLSTYFETEESIAKSVRTAVTYPLIMIVMMLVVVFVLIVQVLPIFNQVFVQLGSELTGFSRSMMNAGELIGRYSVVIVAVLAVIVVALLIVRATPGGKAWFDRFRSRFFATRKLSAKIASGRFASAMSMMLSSGLDVDQSLEMVQRLVDNDPIREKIEKCRNLIDEDNRSFSDALVESEIFSGVHARMVSVGFKTGHVDTVMAKLAAMYEEDVETSIGNTISVLEPTLVAVLSIIVGMILLSVMLPLMGLMSSIG